MIFSIFLINEGKFSLYMEAIMKAEQQRALLGPLQYEIDLY